ncbi:MAG TPA: YfbK domain-containing protein, partial [Thermomonas sp.]|nr:YfbK domain-containing protein [Thermomonas sp.]
KPGEIAHLRLRYKLPQGNASTLVETPILRSQLRASPGESLRFAAAVAAFADALRGGTRMEGWTWEDIATAARAAQGSDPWGLRAEFLQLLAAARVQLGASAPTPATIAD